LLMPAQIAYMKINCKDNLLSLAVELTVHWFSRERNRFGGTLVIGQGAQLPAMFQLQILGRDLVERGILFGGESRKSKSARIS
jgi:hypothetical protein